LQCNFFGEKSILVLKNQKKKFSLELVDDKNCSNLEKFETVLWFRQPGSNASAGQYAGQERTQENQLTQA
jgi:hypothetical protein